jgi:uncharacterized Zn finger protein
MTDIFDTQINCKKCGIEMEKGILNRDGFELRAVRCSECGDQIIHPADVNGMEHFKDIQGKRFNVKLRIVGNSHAISIPKEIIEFINEQHKSMSRDMDDMVRMWFDDFETLKVRFGENNEEER